MSRAYNTKTFGGVDGETNRCAGTRGQGEKIIRVGADNREKKALEQGMKKTKVKKNFFERKGGVSERKERLDWTITGHRKRKGDRGRLLRNGGNKRGDIKTGGKRHTTEKKNPATDQKPNKESPKTAKGKKNAHEKRSSTSSRGNETSYEEKKELLNKKKMVSSVKE